MSDYKAGRWSLGDLAGRKSDGKLFAVIGFIGTPAVIFAEIVGTVPEGQMGEQVVEVAGCPNELEGYTRFAKQNDGE